jgi:hypothetical protein
MPNQVTIITTFIGMNFHSNTPFILNNEGQGQQIQILVNVDELETHRLLCNDQVPQVQIFNHLIRSPQFSFDYVYSKKKKNYAKTLNHIGNK